MEMKILSGVLVTRDSPREGQATIDLDKNDVAVGADGQPLGPEGIRVSKERTVGSGRYTSNPCKTFALREMKVGVMHELHFREGDRDETDIFRIDDIATSDEKRYMAVKWTASSRSGIEEISYMVIGETD